MLTKQKLSRRTRGFTLTEAAIVLGIVGLILGAIWVAAGAVYNNQRVATTTTQILQMVNGIRSLYSTQTVYAGTVLEMADAGAVPSDMVTVNAAGSATAVNNVWNGAVTITASGAPAGTEFTVVFPLVPKEACINLLMRLTGRGRDNGLAGAGVTGAVTSPVPPTGFTIGQASTACSGLTNSLQLEFSLRS